MEEAMRCSGPYRHTSLTPSTSSLRTPGRHPLSDDLGQTCAPGAMATGFAKRGNALPLGLGPLDRLSGSLARAPDLLHAAHDDHYVPGSENRFSLGIIGCLAVRLAHRQGE